LTVADGCCELFCCGPRDDDGGSLETRSFPPSPALDLPPVFVTATTGTAATVGLVGFTAGAAALLGCCCCCCCCVVAAAAAAAEDPSGSVCWMTDLALSSFPDWVTTGTFGSITQSLSMVVVIEYYYYIQLFSSCVEKGCWRFGVAPLRRFFCCRVVSAIYYQNFVCLFVCVCVCGFNSWRGERERAEGNRCFAKPYYYFTKVE